MFNSVIQTLQKVYQTHELRRKLLFTLGVFFIFRFLAHIPLPSINLDQLQILFNSNQLLNLLNVFSGGTLANFSVAAVGISPYITASIIMQLGGMVIPQIKELQKDGESGRERLNQYTRLMTVPLAIVQSISVLALLRTQGLLQTNDPIALAAMIMSLVAGAMIVTWLGEMISEYGIGNGISMILFGAIISQLPASLSQALFSVTSDQTLTILTFGALFIAIIGLIVFMNEAIRKVTIQYAKRQRGSRVYGGQMTHLPIRVNVAGVMPIIFAVSILMVPPFFAGFMISSGQRELVEIGQWLTINFAQTAPVFMITYFVVVFFFTFFSALIFFNAENISDELKKSGAFIPGIRPGAATKKYLEFVVSRITLAGAFFLGVIALLPSFAQVFTNIGTLAISGTSVLIVVSVILETMKQVDSMLVEQDYERYL